MMVTTKAGHTLHGFGFPSGAEVRRVQGKEFGYSWVQVLCPDVPKGSERGPSWENMPAHAVEFAEVAVYVPSAVQLAHGVPPYVSCKRAQELGATDISVPPCPNPLFAGADRVAKWPETYWPSTA